MAFHAYLAQKVNRNSLVLLRATCRDLESFPPLSPALSLPPSLPSTQERGTHRIEQELVTKLCLDVRL
jgi:hypothetical protein